MDQRDVKKKEKKSIIVTRFFIYLEAYFDPKF